jgi:hypothetical protein
LSSLKGEEASLSFRHDLTNSIPRLAFAIAIALAFAITLIVLVNYLVIVGSTDELNFQSVNRKDEYSLFPVDTQARGKMAWLRALFESGNLAEKP